MYTYTENGVVFNSLKLEAADCDTLIPRDMGIPGNVY